jgi:hypothetical protein
MLVKTPAMKLGVDIRDAETRDGFLILSGAANAMPCTVEMSGRELWSLTGRLLRPAVIALMLKSIFLSTGKQTDRN